MSQNLVQFSNLLLSKENPDVKRTFEATYINETFKYYMALKVPQADIVKFFHKAQVTGADPIKDQIYLIPRNVNIGKNGRDEWVTVGTVVFSYHFVETKAVESGEYEGYTIKTGVMPYFDPIVGQVKEVLCSEAVVFRKGKAYPFTAWWPEYVQTGKYGVTSQWKTKPHLMLEKCAKAGALRAAFPEWLSGAYTQEEMGAIEKDEDSVIETTLAERKEVQKVEEIQERIETKIAQAESMGEIEGLMEKIKVTLGKLTEGETVVTKGLAMFNNLGVHKFEDLKKKSVAELKAGLATVEELLKEKQLREANSRATKAAPHSFKLENP